MTRRIIQGLKELRTLVGSHLGTSEWVLIDQPRINSFADATEDHQWIHCDEERARAETQYKTTIAHGFLTLSLGPALAEKIFTIAGAKLTLNYGMNRVRFPAPVKCGSRLRLRLELIDLKDVLHGAQAVYKQTFEVEGDDKPVCVAENVVRYFFSEDLEGEKTIIS